MNTTTVDRIKWMRLLSTSAILFIALNTNPTSLLIMAMNPYSQASTQDERSFFYVYKDADFPDNHYKPTGYMGDSGDIQINEAYETGPHSGKTCLRVIYSAKGKGPNTCNYSPPCKWAGVYWQEPPNNWGTEELMKGRGLDLSSYNRLTFWAKADKKCTVEFKVGGINQRYGDSLAAPRGIIVNLTNNWQQVEINLSGAKLEHMISGFCWTANMDNNPDGAVFYLDDIRFERRK